jgi:hypothetical protein
MSAEEQTHITTEDQQIDAVEDYTEEEKKLGQAFLDAIVAGDLVSVTQPMVSAPARLTCT